MNKSCIYHIYYITSLLRLDSAERNIRLWCIKWQLYSIAQGEDIRQIRVRTEVIQLALSIYGHHNYYRWQ